MEYKVTEHKEDKCIVRIHKPILTEEESNAREKDARKSLVRFGREVRNV